MARALRRGYAARRDGGARDDDRVTAVGEILWSPPAPPDEASQIGRSLAWLRAERGLRFDGYDELWRWSVDDLEGFWARSGTSSGSARRAYERVLGSRAMPGAEWFPGARLNYAEHVLGRGEDRRHGRGASRARRRATRSS